MASLQNTLAIAIIAMLICASDLAGKSQAQSCTNYLTLASCIPAATGSTAPTAQCCNLVKGYRSKPACLCQVLLAAKKSIPSIDLKKAVQLPKKCKLQKFIPKNYKCGGVLIPHYEV